MLLARQLPQIRAISTSSAQRALVLGLARGPAGGPGTAPLLALAAGRTQPQASGGPAAAPVPSGGSGSDEAMAGEIEVDDVADLFAACMPKHEIGALRFLQEYPEYDGRGVKICIFDTGVDPGAAGLQVTTDGKPKIIDILDCSGSGDVDLARSESGPPGCTLTGASGRRLTTNPGWANPTGEWRLGAKHVYDLVSRGLVTRLKEERRRKWDEAQRGALAEAVAALARFDKDTPASRASADAGREERAELEARVALLKDLTKSYEDPGPLLDCVVWHDGAHWRAALDTSDLHPPGGGRGALADFVPLTNYALEHKYGTFSELDSCDFVLNILEAGRLLSIVVDCGAHGTHVAGITAAHFPDDPGSNGIAPGAQVISCKIGDTRLGSMETGTGVVRGLVAARQHGAHLINMSYGEPTITPNQGRFIDLATELVRKHNVIFVASAGNAGPALSTVGAPGGTSSALFGVGAYVSPQLAAAGHSVVAPPAGGLQYTWSSRGPAADGGGGVAFSAPGGAIAPVPQWTQQRRQLMNGTSMSSPNACGGIALLLSGLLAGRGGGAAGVAPHRIRRALENTALPLGGGAADGVLTYGRGLIQIDAAWEYLLRDGVGAAASAVAAAPTLPPSGPPSPPAAPSSPTSSPIPAPAAAPAAAPTVSSVCGPWYDVEVACSEGRGPRGRGVYVREPHEAAKAQSYKVTVTPRLPEHAANSERLGVEDRLALEASVPWVTCPPALMLHHAGRSFELLVDPTGLPPGLHYGEVHALEVDARHRGPLFRVPITVIVPLHVPLAITAGPSAAAAAALPPSAPPSRTLTPAAGVGPFAAVTHPPAALAAAAAAAGANGGGVGTVRLGPLAFSPGSEHRSFVAVPPGATWAELTLRAGPYDTPKLFLIRGTQLRPEASYRQHELRTQVTLSGQSEYLASLAVMGGSTLELTLAQFWSSAGDSRLEQVELSFYGVEVAAEGASGGRPGGRLLLDGAEVARPVMVSAPTWSRATRVKPEARLTAVDIPLRPAEAALEPLTGERDSLTDGRVLYRLVLSYRTTLAEGGKFKPRLPLLNKLIYDSPLESQLLLVHDGATKQLLSCQDASPESVTLRKGAELLLRLSLRHDSPELLDRMRGMPLILQRTLDGGGVALPVYGSRRDAILAAGGGGGGGGAPSAAGDVLLRPGDVAPLWLGPLPEDRLPKDATPGRVLKGSLSLGQLKRGGGAAPHKVAVAYVVPPTPAAASSGGGGAAKDDAADKGSPEDKLREAVRDARIKVLKDLKLSDAASAALYDRLLAELAAEQPAHVPLLTEHLRKMDGREASVRSTPAGLAAVVAAADAVIAAVDAAALAAFLGVKANADTQESRKAKKDMDEAKAALVDALARKAGALLEAEQMAAAAAAAAAASAMATATAAAAAAAVGGAAEGDAGAAAPAAEEEGGGGDAAAEGEAGAASSAAATAEGAGATAAPPPPPPPPPSPPPTVAAATATADVASAAGAAPADAFTACMKELRKWVDTASDPPHLLLHAKAEARAKRYASALRSLDKLLGSDDKAAAGASARKEVSDLRAKLFASLGWAHAEAQERDLQAVRFPRDLALL